MAPEDGEKSAAAAPGRLDVIAVAHAYHFCSRQAREAGDSRDANRHRRIYRAETQQNNHRELQQQGGDSQQDIDQAHDGGFHASGQRPGEGAKGGTHHQADGDGDQRRRQGMHRAVNHPRPQVAPQLVGTQPVVRLRRQALSAGDPLQRVRGGKPLWGNGH